MQKWEYITVELDAGEYSINGQKAAELKKRPLHGVLTPLAQEDWELVGIASFTSFLGQYIFKRPTQS